ncbi:MAG: hypothetical protein FWG28_00720 [Clostridiales bacterium]|nr:hypothetical protein [Clostridiales bacterium]
MFDTLLQNKFQILAILMTIVTIAISFFSASYWGKRVRDMKINPKTGKYELPPRQKKAK